jgi:hypothetical protein
MFATRGLIKYLYFQQGESLSHDFVFFESIHSMLFINLLPFMEKQSALTPQESAIGFKVQIQVES